MFCLKIPTGGGKTLLAVKTIDLVQSLYLKRQTGLVVWIVPTLQIYRQTLQRLKDRDDPYRQHLDMVSAGKTLILEKTDGFTPQDVDEHLAVLLLMLPSASRANKEALRMFRDSRGVSSVLPAGGGQGGARGAAEAGEESADVRGRGRVLGAAGEDVAGEHHPGSGTADHSG